MKQDPINTGSYTLGLLVANTKNMADTQAQNNLIVGNHLKDAYNKLANAYALNLQQEQLEKQNAFKQESLNLQKQQITNQVQQWWDTKKQWAEQNKLEKQKMQESARVANLQFDLANRQLAYQKERDKPSIGLQQHQLDSLTSLSINPLLQVPTTQDFGVAGRSAGVSPTNGGSGGSARNAEVNFGIVGRSVAGANTAGFGAAANTAPIAGGFYTIYSKSQMPQKDSTSNGGLNITGKDVLTAALGQDKLTQAAKVGGFYTIYLKSQMPQKHSTNAVSLAAQKPKDELAKYFIPASKAKPRQINTQEFLIPAYQAVLIKLDNDMPLSAQDKYVANLMGLKYDEKEQLRIADVGKNIDAFEERIASLQNLSESIYKGQKTTGMLNAIDRKIHNKTWGWWDINAENQEYNGIDMGMLYEIARGLVGGKPTNLDKENAKVYSTLGRNKEEQRSILYYPYVKIVREAVANIEALKKKGHSLAEIEKMEKQIAPYIESAKYLEKTNKNPQSFQYNYWKELTLGEPPIKNKQDEMIYIK